MEGVNSNHRPAFGRWLCGGLWSICAFALIREFASSPSVAGLSVPWFGLVSLAIWVAYWRPCVSVDDSGVHLVNVLRTVDLPWPSIQRIDTKWALTLYTAYGAFTAWAAPAPGIRAAARLHAGSRPALPESAVSDGVSIRPGDLPGSPSGDAANTVRRRWEELRDAGFLDNPRLEFARPPVRWHWSVIAAGGVLVLGCVASIVAS